MPATVAAGRDRARPVCRRPAPRLTAVPAESGTEPASTTPPEVAQAQRQLHLLQWVVPALTGAIIVVDAKLGEQQRPTNVLDGITARIPGLSG